MTDSNIAILIDYENVGVESLQNLTEQLSGLGRIIVKRAYADWSSQRKGQEKLIELGIEAEHLQLLMEEFMVLCFQRQY